MIARPPSFKSSFNHAGEMPMLSLERLRGAIPTATEDDEELLLVLGAAASDAVRAWCGREFTQADYDALLPGCAGDRLLLPHYPVRGVQSVRGQPRPVLQLRHQGSEIARAEGTPTHLVLSTVTAGVAAIDSVPWADNPTLQDVADAVETLFGWQARVVPGWETHPSTDLAPGLLGTSRFAAGLWAGLELHTREVADYRWHPAGWLEGSSDDSWRGGTNAWRVAFRAGYDPPPTAVVQAAALWAAELFFLTARDPALAHQALGGSLSQTWLPPLGTPPARVAALIEPYRRRSV
jgi:hypothetical protein